MISAIASEQYRHAGGQEFIGIHAKSIEKATDESEYARWVAAKSGIRLVTVEPTSDDFAATLDEVVYTQEEPFGSPSMFMGWHVFREASRQGCRVMLNGQGSDEGASRTLDRSGRVSGFFKNGLDGLSECDGQGGAQPGLGQGGAHGGVDHGAEPVAKFGDREQ
ncbi:MAG: hypothetical protein EBY18_24345 [Alphaproteobacteria bacterium]|nr:hypothetical protein [Alphaproteobacteria bacterium]